MITAVRLCAAVVFGTAALVACEPTPAGNTPGPAPPRLRAPLSTALVTNARPTLAWDAALPGTEVEIELCGDRNCSRVLQTLRPSGAATQPSEPLPRGVIWWRAFGRDRSGRGAIASATWQFIVPARDAPGHTTSRAATPDFDADGFADVVITAEYVDHNTGRAYVYRGSAQGIAAAPDQSIYGPDWNAYFGTAVTCAGDLDGDGYPDLAIGAPAFAHNQGRVYVYRGGANGLSLEPAWTLSPPDDAEGNFGVAVAGAGDLDGDGYGDLLVGEPGRQFASRGRVWVHRGGPGGVALAGTLIRESVDAPSSQFGRAIAGGFDLDGDGFTDFAVTNPATGRAGVYLGSAGELVTSAARSIPVPWLGPIFNMALASAGDVDGDGFADLIASATDGTEGHATLIFGAPSESSVELTVRSLAPSEGQPAPWFGTAVASAGDVNRDGFADLVVGAGNARPGRYDAYVYLGRSDRALAAPSMAFTRTDRGFATAVLGGRDMNGDGFDDVVVSAMDEQTAFIFAGSADALAVEPAWSLRGPLGGGFGTAIACAWPSDRVLLAGARDQVE